MVGRSRETKAGGQSASELRLLVIDDEADTLLPILAKGLEPLGFTVAKVASPERALQAVADGRPDVILLDLHFPGDDRAGDAPTTGGKLMTTIRRRFASIPVVVFTSRLSDVDIPLETFEERPHSYFAKPDFEDTDTWPDRLAQAMRDAIAAARYAHAPEDDDLGFVVGQTREMREVAAAIRTASGNTLTVLIYGETGTGKQRAAEAIHRLSGRTGRFEHYNCSGVHAETLDSTLFGHERGAFTGASAPKAGLFELADRGTLFLDEIQGMPMELQGRLMTAVEAGKVRRMGATSDKTVDVRLIVATNHSLSELVADGVLRDDLAFRFAGGLLISLPPLRQRMSDLPAFFAAFIERANEATKRQISNALRPETLEKLKGHPWPGNIRELESTLFRAVATTNSNVLLPDDIVFIPISRPGTERSAVGGESAAPLSSPQSVVDRSADSAVTALADHLENLPVPERYEFLKDQGDSLRRDVLIEFICRLRRKTGRRVQHKTLAAELDPLADTLRDLNRIRQFLHSSGVRLTLLDCNQ